MSVHVSSLVWKFTGLSSSEKLVMLKLADTANDEGESAYPSVGTIMRETGLSERTVQVCLKALRDKGFLIVDGRHERRRTTVHRLDLEMLKNVFPEPAMGAATAPPQPLHPRSHCTHEGAATAPNTSFNHPKDNPPKVPLEDFAEDFAKLVAVWKPFDMDVGNLHLAERKHAKLCADGMKPDELLDAADRYIRLKHQLRSKTSRLNNWLSTHGWVGYLRKPEKPADAAREKDALRVSSVEWYTIAFDSNGAELQRWKRDQAPAPYEIENLYPGCRISGVQVFRKTAIVSSSTGGKADGQDKAASEEISQEACGI